ncbi:MAG: ATP-binding protein [Clostridiales bacterium]|jgi:predicted ATPase|nr:ATP-binding protein [Clostridiales bacterium]
MIFVEMQRADLTACNRCQTVFAYECACVHIQGAEDKDKKQSGNLGFYTYTCVRAELYSTPFKHKEDAMEEIYVSNIRIDKFDYLTDSEIQLSTTERKHFVVTGVNGSGKTRFLESLRDALVVTKQKASGESDSDELCSKDDNRLTLSYSRDISSLAGTTILYFPASREAVRRPKRVVIDLSKSKPYFLDFMLSIQDHNKRLYRKCFSGLQGFLQEIFEIPELELRDDIYEDNYGISIPGSEPFPIEQLSDSYASLINIYAELMMSSVIALGTASRKINAIVLIDELEAHLHVSLQRRIFAILSQAFPNVQFMVTTNSPILCTEKCAILFDVGNSERLDMSEMEGVCPYSSFIQGYFKSNQHSDALLNDYLRYSELRQKQDLTPEESEEFRVLLYEFSLMYSANLNISLAFSYAEEARIARING